MTRRLWTLPASFQPHNNSLWDTDAHIMGNGKPYWLRGKRFASMSERERQQYLDSHAKRWPEQEESNV